MDAILSNMFKYTGFSEVNQKWVQGILVPIIEKAKKTFNISEEEITNCKKKACDKIREKYELLLLAPLYIFMDSSRVGAGPGEGVGAGHFLAKFSIDQANKQFKKDFTDAINYGTGGSLPQTVFSYEKLFTDWLNQPGNMAVHEMMKRTKGYTKAGPYFGPFYQDHPRSECNIASYFGFWYAYIYWGGKVVLKCAETEGEDFNCNQETKMTQVVNLNEQFLCATKSCKKVIILQRNPCQEQALAEQYGFSACCNFNKNISSNRAAMLKVLKFTIQSPHLMESVEEELSIFPNMSQAFPAYKTIQPSENTRRNFNPFIPLCQYSGQPEVMSFRSCNMFKRTYTDMGIAYSFNSDKFGIIYKETENSKEANKAFFFNNKEDVRYPESSGKEFILKIVLEANMEQVEQFEQQDNYKLSPRPILLTVHDPKIPPTLRSEGIEVQLGYETTILITPRVLQTTEDAISSLSPKQRKCRTQYENKELKIFKAYSRKACTLECRMTEAARHCGCTPWNYPTIEGSLLCDAVGIHCFEQVLRRMTNNTSCDCPNNCEDVTYSFLGSSKRIEELNCPKEPHEDNWIHDFYYKDSLPKKFLAFYDYVTDNKEYGEKELCKKNMKYRAIVNFQLVTQSVSRTTQDLKQSFADKLSTFGKFHAQLQCGVFFIVIILGGTLGLFTGMSILSMAEVIFWIIR